MRTLGLMAAAAAVVWAGAGQAAEVRSISRIAFGPADTLFVADWKRARIVALKLPPASHGAAGPFNILDLTGTLARALKLPIAKVDDMAVRPGTGEVYVAAEYGANRIPLIARISANGAVTRLDLARTPESSATLPAAPGADVRFWGRIPERSFTVTDMKWRPEGHELFVAGLSNQSFASTLRRIPFPFDGRESTTSVEIYHTSHNQIETRAPIRAMTFASWGGASYLVAAYTCTPIVTIPLDALKDGAHVRGKTIAELGYGNTPADMVSYTQTQDGKTTPYVMLVNYERSADVIPLAQIEAADAKPPMSQPVSFGKIEGLQPQEAPFAGVVRIDNLNDKYLIAVRNDVQTARTQLVTFDKGFQFRLSDFVSEYNFPSYSYAGNQFQTKYIKPVQDELKTQEGFATDVHP